MQHQCQCVFPSPTEQELLTIPGAEPGTALRVFVEAKADGYVRLQQLAYDEGLGWYAQKTMVLPREVLSTLIPQLRKALCLMPPARRTLNPDGVIAFPRLVQPPAEPEDPLERVGG